MTLQTAVEYLETVPGFKIYTYSPALFSDSNNRISIRFSLEDGTYYAVIPDTENMETACIRIATGIMKMRKGEPSGINKK